MPSMIQLNRSQDTARERFPTIAIATSATKTLSCFAVEDQCNREPIVILYVNTVDIIVRLKTTQDATATTIPWTLCEFKIRIRIICWRLVIKFEAINQTSRADTNFVNKLPIIFQEVIIPSTLRSIPSVRCAIDSF